MQRLWIVGMAGLLIGGPSGQRAASYELRSPDGAGLVTVTVGERLTYSITWRGETVVAPSPISMTLGDGTVLGPRAAVLDERRRAVDEIIVPVVPEKTSRIRDHYDELSLDFDGGWGLDVRAYDDGVAYRMRTALGDTLVVRDEEVLVRLEGNPSLWFPREEGFLTHSERIYERPNVRDVPAEHMAHLPLLAELPDGLILAVTESDLRDYPGLYLAGTGGDALRGVFPAYPAAVEQENDRTVRVTAREPYLARTSGSRTFPWRVFVVAEHAGDLVETTMVYRFAPELAIEDPSWIQPGKVAWDWWNALNVFGVDFESGVNTATYRYYIDFAADHGIEYVILDEGWSTPGDLSELNSDVDLDALRAHAADRGVGLILWVVWKALEDQLEETLDRFAAWGIAGIKVDFMQRDDQPMVNYYWRVARAAADRHLLVDFHGAYKPAGLRRAYPNVLTREGVRGLEWVKWSEYPNPEHDVTLPFTRMLAGPMDFTPGAMLNAQERQFHAVFDRPMSMGTRVHQLAMYVVYESPLQMLSDSPSHYLREPGCLAFLSGVPTVWDETRVLTARVGDWIAVARRRGEVWYVGAMTDWEPRDLELDLGFLGEGNWTVAVHADGPNAHRNAVDHRHGERTVSAGEMLRVHLAPGGGWVGVFSR